MDSVTYPDSGVQEELSRWLLVRVDVSEHPGVADLFEVAGIPVAVAVKDLAQIAGAARGALDALQGVPQPTPHGPPPAMDAIRSPEVSHLSAEAHAEP